ncbi:MAG: type II toxin-antitoxin system RelE/ParE family toxin [Marinilabiliaceae bacterium]|nr:type II toxin-antitoxin system RelE/ParE family toxin [Marinilabiliaceae bacterium]
MKAGNEYRVVMFAIDHLSFVECRKVVCLYGFQKKSSKDYKNAIKLAERVLDEYLRNTMNHGTDI